jgi:DNA-binding response OmpR family regulator
MNYPRVVVYERDGRLAQLLRQPVQERGWALREPRQTETCLRELAGGSPTVFVLRVGAKLEQELALLEQTSWLQPETRTIVVGDVEHESLANLAWDLGASYVLFPPLPRELLPDIVAGLMSRAIADLRPQPAPPIPDADELDEAEPAAPKAKREGRHG